MEEQDKQVDTLAKKISQYHAQQEDIGEFTEEDFMDILAEAFKKIDEERQDFIMDGRYQEIIIDLEKKYKLGEEETGKIQLATLLALLELYPRETAEQDITLALRSRSDAEIERIVKEIRKRIFSTIDSRKMSAGVRQKNNSKEMV